MNFDDHDDELEWMFDPLSTEFIRDPYPTYEQLRKMKRMHRAAIGLRLAARHADVSFVLNDRRFGKKFEHRMTERLGPEIMEAPAYRAMSHWILQKDPPDHARLRGVVVRAFAARTVEAMRHRIQKIVDDTLDRLIPRRHMDVVGDFAQIVPLAFICEMLGIPEEYHEMFRLVSRSVGRLLDPVLPSKGEIDSANNSTLKAHSLCLELIELTRRQPSDTLMARLIEANHEGVLSEEELTASVILMFGAGHETTLHMIGNGLLALHRDPNQLEILKENPAIIGRAVEELLRFDSSAQSTGRVAMEDIRGPNGVLIAKGEGILCLLGSANRDALVYPDKPDRVILNRSGPKPLFFGGGIHFCVGAQLARIQLEVALSTLLRRIPNLQLHDIECPKWRRSFVLRGTEELAASW